MPTMNSNLLFRLFQKLCAGFLVALLLSCVFFVQRVPHASAAAASCLPNCSLAPIEYIHMTSFTNTTGFYTDLNNAYLNNNPQAKVIVTSNWTPFGDTEYTVGTSSNIGVWYHGGRWSIFNEDHAAMPTDAAFNVYAVPGSDTTFVHTATAANSASDYSDINNALTNNQPNAKLFVTQNWNPNGSSYGQYDNHPLGVWYHNGHWSIFNEDGTAIPTNAAFNVLVQPAAFVQIASVANNTSDATCIDNPAINGNSYASVFVTPNWDLGALYVQHSLAAEYHTDINQWCINNIGAAPIPVGAAFNVFA